MISAYHIYFMKSKRLKRLILLSGFRLFLCLLFIGLASTSSQADQGSIQADRAHLIGESPWQRWKTSDSLSVYYRDYKETGLIEIKAQARLQSSLSGFLLFLQDYPLIPNWLENAKSADLIEQTNDTENLFVTSFYGIWPVSEREMVIRSRYWQNSDLSVELQVEDAAHEVPNPDHVIRIKIEKAHWILTPLAQGKIKIKYIIVADPMGKVPLWIANKVALRSMWNTLNALETQLALSVWQHMPIPGIIEPAR
ncbi:START domain-containing protein [Marinomonas sp. MED121]|uniref:START domain-containing protein n=1 Tax=Marinomonas sp. MED121 TaxID=314277 RepID=UPI0002FA4390|nr:START domain-containing protein [Marinomonas sp. MED121]